MLRAATLPTPPELSPETWLPSSVYPGVIAQLPTTPLPSPPAAPSVTQSVSAWLAAHRTLVLTAAAAVFVLAVASVRRR